MKKLIFILSLLVSLSMNAQVQTDSTVRAKIRANIPDNMTRSITPLMMRTTLNTMMDYILKYTELMTVGAGGKSFSIKPKGIGTGLGTAPPAVPKDLYEPFVAHAEDSLKTIDLHGRRVNVLYKTKQVFYQHIIINAPAVSATVISGVQELLDITTEANFRDFLNLERNEGYSGLVKFDHDTHVVTVSDYNCVSCTQKRIFLTLIYTKL